MPVEGVPFWIGDVRVDVLQASGVERLQAFFEANPAYFVMIGGAPAAPGEAQTEFNDRPPPAMGHRWAGTLAFDATDGQMQAVAQVVADLMVPGVWHIGLFIVDARLHGSGAAARLYGGLEGWIRSQGAQWLRLGVVEANPRAARFWQRMGYTELRRRPGQVFGQLTHTVCVLAKPLAARGLDEYLALVARDRPEPAEEG